MSEEETLPANQNNIPGSEADDAGARRVSDEDYARAREAYELGQKSVADLAAELGITRQALSKRFRADGVVRGSKAEELRRAAQKATQATVERFAEKRAELIEETRLSGLNALKHARMIGQKIVADALKAGRELGTVDDDLRALQRFNKVLVENLTTALSILKADEHVDDEDLPMLTIEDLTDEDILEHYKATGVLPEDADLDDLAEEMQK